MNKNTRILCVCRKGITRSVGTKRGLNSRGYNDVLAVGSDLVSSDTLDMLCEWADYILLAQPAHGLPIKSKYHSKINKQFNIGDDLKTRVKKQLDLIKL